MPRDSAELDRIATDVVTRLSAEPRAGERSELALAYDAAIMAAAAADATADTPVPAPRSTT